jgi:hypothetical protein
MRVHPTADLAQLIGPAPFDIEPTAPAFADFTPAPSAPARIYTGIVADAPVYSGITAPYTATTGRAALAFILAFAGLLAFAAIVFAAFASTDPTPVKRADRLPQHHTFFALTQK